MSDVILLLPDSKVIVVPNSTDHLENLDEVGRKKDPHQEIEVNITENPTDEQNDQEQTTSSFRGMYECNICDKRFPSPSSLATHRRTHTSEKPFQCQHCIKKFATKKTLNEHEYIHTGQKPYQCKICKESYRQSGQLSKHMKIHGVKQYKCNQCDSDFLDKEELIEHRKTHEKVYFCDKCGKKYTRLHQAQLHMRTHTGEEKPYACEQCGKRFDRRTNLRSHMRTHTGERPYQCEKCAASFSARASLKKHRCADAIESRACTDFSATSFDAAKSCSCGFTFSSYQDYKAHKCPQNGNSNSSTSNNDDQSDELLYKCAVCSYTFESLNLAQNHDCNGDNVNDIVGVTSGNQAESLVKMDQQNGGEYVNVPGSAFVDSGELGDVIILNDRGEIIMGNLMSYVDGGGGAGIDESGVRTENVAVGVNGTVTEIGALAENGSVAENIGHDVVFPKNGVQFLQNQDFNALSTKSTTGNLSQTFQDDNTILLDTDGSDTSLLGKAAMARTSINDSDFVIFNSSPLGDRDTVVNTIVKLSESVDAMNTNADANASSVTGPGEFEVVLHEFSTGEAGSGNYAVVGEVNVDEPSPSVASLPGKSINKEEQFDRTGQCVQNQSVSNGNVNENIQVVYLDQDVGLANGQGKIVVSYEDCNALDLNGSDEIVLDCGKNEEQIQSGDCQYIREDFLDSGDHKLDGDIQGEENLREDDAKVFTCNICALKLSSESKLKLHLQRHSNQEPYKSSNCWRTFFTNSECLSHLNTHSNTTPYQCENCGIFLCSASSLARHKECHRSEHDGGCQGTIEKGKTESRKRRRICCEIYGKTFSSAHYFKIHSKHHTGELPWQCPECSINCSSQNNLLKHMQSHLRDRPHKCNICDKRFARCNTLKHHMHTHSGAKPYACKYCSKRYRQRAHKIAHERTHTGNKPFACQYCEYRTSWRSCYYLHTRTAHSVVVPAGSGSENANEHCDDNAPIVVNLVPETDADHVVYTCGNMAGISLEDLAAADQLIQEAMVNVPSE